MSLSAGTRIGPYEILSPLGAGGMGEVYRAADPRLGRDVAIKVLPASLSDDPDRLRRFEQEAKAAGMLNHPNITSVYDVGQHDGAPYVVQELLEGETLRAALAGGRFSMRRAVETAVEIARGLAAAHEKGIVHRDLKPENVFVTNDGRTKILDFGLAKLTLAGEVRGETNAPTVSPGTEPGVVLGTLGYMSPEQVRGRAADHRSDIFSLGAILYEMLSGRRAFHGDSAADTMSAILREDPPELSSTGSTVPPGLDRIIRHCLEKNPERRSHSAHDLAFELESLSQTSAAAIAPLPAPRGRSGMRAGLIVAGLAAVAAAAYLAGRSTGPRSHEGGFATYSRLTNLAGRESAPSLSPDGKTLAFVKQTSGKLEIWVQRAGGHKPTNLTAECDSDSYAPAFSSDGNSIAYGSACGGGGIFVMGATGENVRKLVGLGNDPAWTPDGRTIVYATEIGWTPYSRASTSELWIADASTGATHQIFAGDAVQPSVSPHGLRVAYWGLPYSGSQRDIWTIPLKGLAKGEKPVAVTHDAAVDWNPAWSPDGKFLWFLSNRSGAMNLWRVAIDEATGRVRGEPEPQTLPAAEVAGFSLSRDGRRLAYVVSDQSFTIARAGYDTATGQLRSAPVEVLRTAQQISNPVLSPDGQWLVFDSQGGYQEDLSLMHPDGSGLRQLTDDAFRDRLPDFSPDGQRIVFMSDRSGDWELWTIAPDGSDLTRLTPKNHVSIFTPLWSPDGKTIAASTGMDVVFFVLDGKGAVAETQKLPRPEPDLGLLGLGWLPDGRFAAGLIKQDFTLVKVGLFDPPSRKWETIPPPPKTVGTPTLLGLAAAGRRLIMISPGGLYSCDFTGADGRLILPHPAMGAYTGITVDRAAGALYLVQTQDNADIWQATLP